MNTYPVVHIDHDFLFPYSGMVFDSSQVYYHDLFEDCRINNRYLVIWNPYDGKNNIATLAKVHEVEDKGKNQIYHHLVGLKKCKIVKQVTKKYKNYVQIEEIEETLHVKEFNIEQYFKIQNSLRFWARSEAPDLNLRKEPYKIVNSDVSIVINRIIDFVVQDRDLKFIFMNTTSLNEQLNLIASFFNNEDKSGINFVAAEAIKSYYKVSNDDFVNRICS